MSKRDKQTEEVAEQVGQQPERLSFKERMQRMALEWIERLPYVPQLRLFAEDLNAVRPWWPLVIPLLLWVGRRSYAAEREQMRRAQVAARLLAAAESGELLVLPNRDRRGRFRKK